MALTKTPIELSSTPSIVDGGNATAITIDSSEKVGIGNSSPANKLAVNGAISIEGAAAAGISEGLLIDWSTNLARFLTYDSSSGSEIAFFTQPNGGSTTERVRIKEDGGFVLTPAAGGHAVFNEGSIDADFRVESNGNANMLFVDGGNDVVCIGGTTVESGDHFEVLSGDTTTNVRIRNTNAGSAAPAIIFDKSSSSPADNDEVGLLNFVGQDSSNNAEVYAQIVGLATDVTAGTEDGKLTFGTKVSGSFNTTLTLENGTARLAQSSETGGQLLLRSNYSDPHFLSTMGTNHSSGGWYFGYGVEMSGSGTTKSTFSNFNGERSLMQLFGNRLQLNFAGAQNTTIGDSVSLTESVRIDAQGIKFNGDTATANGLDDYEEGSWDPLIIAGTTNPSGGGNLARDGHYVKIGRQVWVSFYVGVSWTNSPSGGVFVSNMPFTIANSADNTAHIPVTTYNFGFGTNGAPFIAPQTNQTNARLYEMGAGGWGAADFASHVTSPLYITGQFTYYTA